MTTFALLFAELHEDDHEKLKKLKSLYDRPGTPGEKAAAKAAMDRIHARNGTTPSYDAPPREAKTTYSRTSAGFAAQRAAERRGDNAPPRDPEKAARRQARMDAEDREWREQKARQKAAK